MKLFYENKILAAIIAVTVIISSFASFGRIGVESRNKPTDIVVDYTELEKMAEQSDHNISWWLSEFKKLGINKVGLSEENISSLAESGAPVEAKLMSEIIEEIDWREAYPHDVVSFLEQNGFDKYDVLITAKTDELYRFISDAFSSRYDGKKFRLFPGQKGGTIYVNGTVDDALYSEKGKLLDTAGNGFIQTDKLVGSKIMFISLGLPDDKISIIESAGMEVIPRTYGYDGWNGHKFAEAVFKQYGKLKKTPSYMIFAGREVIGQDDGIEDIKKYIKDNGIIVGLVEDTTQRQNIMLDGLEQLVADTGYQAARVFSVWDYIQNRYQYYNYKGAEEIENTFYRAVTERNIRIIYFKPIKAFEDNHKYITDIEEYKKMFNNFKARIARHGMNIGTASPMGSYSISFISKVIIATGCAAAGILLLSSVLRLKGRIKLSLLILSAFCACGAFYAMPSMSAILTSFASAVIFPSMAVVYLAAKSREAADKCSKDEGVCKIFKTGLKAFIAASLISLAGAVVASSVLADTSFFLEINIFRGVKASQLLPIAVFLVVYLAYFGFERQNKEPGILEVCDIKKVLNGNIKVWMIMVGAVVLAAGYIYLARTGHETSVEPSQFEMIARNILEDKLLARPRTKEFLIAFPAAFLFVYSAIRRFKLFPFIFGLTAVIGQTSIINSFMHLRTPMYIAFARTGYSLLFGIFIALIYLLIFESLHRIIEKRGKENHA